jgi:hypothetical protein
MASRAVLVGFSAARTDFYAAWLLRSTLGVNQTAEVFVVNPTNDTEHGEHNAFTSRMNEIFPQGYHADFRRFAYIDAIIRRVKGI